MRRFNIPKEEWLMVQELKEIGMREFAKSLSGKEKKGLLDVESLIKKRLDEAGEPAPDKWIDKEPRE